MRLYVVKALIWAIRAYQRTLSPDHGLVRSLFPYGVCRYNPTCSQYMLTCLRKQGLKGLWPGLRRLASCHPFTRSHYKPLSEP